MNDLYLCELLTGSKVGVFLQSRVDEEQTLSLLCASGGHFRNLEPLWLCDRLEQEALVIRKTHLLAPC